MKRGVGVILLILSVFFVSVTAEAGFTDNGNGTVTDSRTGLIWQQGEAGAMAWGSALSYCEGLSLGGSTDWRLPNIKELESLTDDSRYNPAIDTNFFPNAYASDYWASTTYAGSPGSAWGVGFYDGYVYSGVKGYFMYVRCVRGGQSGSFANLTISPGSRDFGKKAVESCSGYQKFTLSNTGSANLLVSGFALSDTNNYAFKTPIYLADCPMNIPLGFFFLKPNKACNFSVQFCPQTVGPHDANITISSNDPDGSGSYIPLNGQGVPVIALSSPNGGELWKAGDTQPITWSSKGVPGSTNIAYSRDNGSSWVRLFSNVANTGTQDWTIKNMTCPNACNFEGTKKGLIRIWSASLPAISDISNSNFSVLADCQCVTYIKNTYGWESEATGDAADMGPFLVGHGYRASTDSNGKPLPVNGAIVIFGRTYKNVSGGTFNAKYGHVAMLTGFVGPTIVNGKSKFTLSIRGANQGAVNAITDQACTNVTDKNTGTTYYSEDNMQGISFYIK